MQQKLQGKESRQSQIKNTVTFRTSFEIIAVGSKVESTSIPLVVKFGRGET